MDTLCARSHRFNPFRKDQICLVWSKMNHSRVMRSGYAQFRGVPGVGSYNNNGSRLVKIGRWIEYAWGVKSETINLDRRVDLRGAWISFLSEEILGGFLRGSLEYASRVSGYDTSTRSGIDSLSIPGWLEICSAGSVSGKSRSWYRFSFAIDCKLFNSDDSENIPNSVAILVSGAPEIDKLPIIWITHGGSDAPETWISFADFGITIPLGQYTINRDCSFDSFLQREIYGTVQFDLVDHYTGAPAFHHILDPPNQALVQFTRYLLIIDFISYSLG